MPVLPRALALLGVLVVAVGLAACGGDDEAGTTPTPTEDAFLAGVVSDVGRFNDKGFNQLALEGCQRAESELGVQCRGLESRSTSDYVPNFARLIRDGAGLSIATGFLLAEATSTAADRFPDAQFAIVDYSAAAEPFAGSQENVLGLTFRTNENSYLIGCLAAQMAEREGENTISAVGGIKIPTVDIFIAAYRAGAQRCVPGTRTLIAYSQDFVDQAKCKELALNQIGRGSKVVFQVAGGCGLGALDAARERDVWGIGVDTDQSFLGPHILTSAVKRVDVAVFEAIQTAVEGSFTGGRDLVFDLENGGVAVGEISSEVPEEFIERMNELEPMIRSGEIEPPTTV
ncbi:MAG: BMP family lipoprotein [Gaiellaceae bacterium]